MHKSQILFYLIAAFLIGVFIASFVPSENTVALFLFMAGVITIAVTGYHKTLARTKKALFYRKLWLVVGAALLLCGAGMARYGYFAYQNSVLQEFASHEAGGKGIPIILEGYVDDEPVVSGSRSRLVMRVKSLSVPGQTIPVSERTLITTNAYPLYGYGHSIAVNGAVSYPQNFDDFDYIQYLKNQSIRTVVSFPDIQGSGTMRLGVWEGFKLVLYQKIFSMKHAFELSINQSLPEPYAAYINGILTGSRQNIPDHIQESFNRTSTTHLLAISGYNITVIANSLLLALAFVIKRRRAFWVSVGVIILFTILTGASASVVRASIMGLLLLFALGYGRLYDPINSLVLAGALMVFVNPFALRFDIGFQLSFLAVMGLAYIYPSLDRKLAKIPKLGGLKETILMTLSAQIAVFPLLMFYFDQFSIVSLPANILVLPFVPYAMAAGFAAGIAGLIWPLLGQIVGVVAWAISAYQLAVIQWFASLSWASLNISLTVAGLIATYAIILYALRRFTNRGSQVL